MSQSILSSPPTCNARMQLALLLRITTRHRCMKIQPSAKSLWEHGKDSHLLSCVSVIPKRTTDGKTNLLTSGRRWRNDRTIARSSRACLGVLVYRSCRRHGCLGYPRRSYPCLTLLPAEHRSEFVGTIQARERFYYRSQSWSERWRLDSPG